MTARFGGIAALALFAAILLVPEWPRLQPQWSGVGSERTQPPVPWVRLASQSGAEAIVLAGTDSNRPAVTTEDASEAEPHVVPGPLRAWPVERDSVRIGLVRSDAGGEATAGAAGMRFVSGDSVALRVAPTTRSQVVMRLDTGHPVEEIRRQRRWVLVLLPEAGREGWIHANFVAERDPTGDPQS